MPNTTDQIERNIAIAAPIERVYAAITRPEQWEKWFSDSVEGDFNVGSQPVLDEGKYGRFRIAIVAADPPKYFAYRWVSGMAFVPDGFLGDPLAHPNTLVEFFLESTANGTALRLLETGFDSLPESYKTQNLEDNSGGWDYQLARIKRYMETGDANPASEA